jgi:hypothetical protein
MFFGSLCCVLIITSLSFLTRACVSKEIFVVENHPYLFGTSSGHVKFCSICCFNSGDFSYSCLSWNQQFVESSNNVKPLEHTCWFIHLTSVNSTLTKWCYKFGVWLVSCLLTSLKMHISWTQKYNLCYFSAAQLTFYSQFWAQYMAPSVH